MFSWFSNRVKTIKKLLVGKKPSAPVANRDQDGMVEVNIGKKFARELEKKFGHSNLTYPDGFRPIIEIPEHLGRQLFALYVKSIVRQEEQLNRTIAGLREEDEEFARKLRQSNLLLVKTEPPSSDVNIEQEPTRRETFHQYQVRKYLKERQQLYETARAHLEAGDKLAGDCFEEIRKRTKLVEEENRLASILAKNLERNSKTDTIDLHNRSINDAIAALDQFINKEVRSLQKERLKSRRLRVITGRGRHSPNRVAKIKPKVEQRLRERGLKFSEENPGCLSILIDEHSSLRL